MLDPTPRQADALAAIGLLTAQRGYPPTIGEVAKFLDISPPSALDLLRELAKKGRVAWEPRLARTLRVLAPEGGNPGPP